MGTRLPRFKGDLFNAFYQANHAGLMAGPLGATYFIPTFIVPLLLITHGLGFRILCATSTSILDARRPVLGIGPLGHREGRYCGAQPLDGRRIGWSANRVQFVGQLAAGLLVIRTELLNATQLTVALSEKLRVGS